MSPTYRRHITRYLMAALACATIAPASSMAAWEEVVGGASPVNAVASQLADEPSMASVGGVPYVAWTEQSGAIGQIWVARLNAAGTAWERVGGASPLNIDDAQDASSPVIADVAGVPWVAWRERDANPNFEVRVARLDPSGAWQQAGSGPSPINFTFNQSAAQISLASIGGVAHVAWREPLGGPILVRVAQFNAASNSWQHIGGALNRVPTDSAVSPSLADVGGTPWVAWSELDVDNTEIRAARFSGGVWVEIEPGLSPINHHASQNGNLPRLAVVGGVPHIAWTEFDGTSDQVRVARLNAAGNDWAQIVSGPSPINRTPTGSVTDVSLTGVAAAPYVAWIESDGVNREVRVSRLAPSGAAWEEVVPGGSPVNAAPAENAEHVHITTVGGFPWITWSEGAGASRQVRVARLEPEFGAPGAVATVNGTVGASLFAPVTTYGLPFQSGFSVTGPGGGDTGLAPTSGNIALLQRDVSGLSPSTAYTYRPFATAGVPLPRVIGPVGAFTTPAAKTAVPTPTPTTDPLVASWVDRLVKAKAGTRTRLRYASTRAGRATLELRRGARLVRRFRATPRAGLNAFTILAPGAGSYRLVLTVTTPDAKTAKATARLIVRKK